MNDLYKFVTHTLSLLWIDFIQTWNSGIEISCTSTFTVKNDDHFPWDLGIGKSIIFYPTIYQTLVMEFTSINII